MRQFGHGSSASAFVDAVPSEGPEVSGCRRRCRGQHGYQVRTAHPGVSPYEQAVERPVAACHGESFDVLTEVDAKATARTKPTVDFRKYYIVGACSPRLAHRALRSVAEAPRGRRGDRSLVVFDSMS
jgi:hypothetical protein